MITIYKTDKNIVTKDGNTILAELRGLSTDTKPTTAGDKLIGNGSTFIEIDTGKVFLFDYEGQEWKEI